MTAPGCLCVPFTMQLENRMKGTSWNAMEPLLQSLMMICMQPAPPLSGADPSGMCAAGTRHLCVTLG